MDNWGWLLTPIVTYWVKYHTIIVFVAVAVAQTCPSPIGSALTNPIRESSNTGFYLNLDNPAVCSGTVVAWHFCYYRLIETNIATFAVYRQSPLC